MSKKILVTDGMDAAAVAKLRKDGYEVVEQFYEPDALGGALRDFDAVIVRSATKIKQPQIDAAKGGRLKLIIRAGVGVDNIDVKYAEAAGIQVRNTPRASSNAVAELALALLFACARNISIAGHTMRENKWEKKAYSKGFELEGKTMGVIGYGRIGRMVGEKGQALGMNVLSVVHRNKPEGAECSTMRFVSMDELLAKSDIIVLCAPGGDKPLVDAGSIAKMKDGVVIINVSRGSNVDEAALLEALNGGKVRAAGLDVWLSEKDPNWTLAQHPSVSCTPHVGAGTVEAQKRIGAELVDIVEESFS
ncbi:NAD(P)-dependent oxidoreductase [uncultured Fretibacterium sp.]|uniref:NAD(P)-dependent oxidoreductase n=1 Tax=uncultured Fretibacterium sp. TaxID=1678694 RepID=UPI002614DB31|nr:NAD(P)-dependent oxidoreductase [uncultured Fretibacterium sp.]